MWMVILLIFRRFDMSSVLATHQHREPYHNSQVNTFFRKLGFGNTEWKPNPGRFIPSKHEALVVWLVKIQLLLKPILYCFKKPNELHFQILLVLVIVRKLKVVIYGEISKLYETKSKLLESYFHNSWTTLTGPLSFCFG